MKKLLAIIVGLVLMPMTAGAAVYQPFQGGTGAAAINGIVVGHGGATTPFTGLVGISYGQVLIWNGSDWVAVATSTLGISGSGGGTWGSITGTLSSQTDLQAALNAKQDLINTGNVSYGIFTATTSASTTKLVVSGTATTTNLVILGSFAQTGFGDCVGANKVTYTASTGIFGCAVDQTSGGGADGNWTYFNGSGIRLTTTTNQVLVNGSATTTRAKLEIQSGDAFIYGSATATNLTATGTASTTFLVASRGATTSYLRVDNDVSIGGNATATNLASSVSTTTNLSVSVLANVATMTARNISIIGVSAGGNSSQIPLKVSNNATGAIYPTLQLNSSGGSGSSGSSIEFRSQNLENARISGFETAGPGSSNGAITIAVLNAAGVTEGLRVTNVSGTSQPYVGIGTSSPYAKLSVTGQIVGEYFSATSTGTSTFPNATSTNFAISRSLTLYGTTYISANALCIGLTGSSDLCDGSDASGGAGTATDTAWQLIPAGVRLTTTTNQVLIGALATTTTSALEVNGDVYISGNATTSIFNATGTINAGTGAVGSAAAPTLTLNNQKTFGWYAAGAGTWGWAAAGSSKFVMGSGGIISSIGGGYFLTHQSTGGASAPPYAFRSDDNSGIYQTTTAEGTVSLTSDGVSFFTGSSSISNFERGNLGVGTSSPYAKLSVVGEVVASHFTATTTSTSTFPNATSTNLSVSRSFTLFGGTYTTNNALCQALTGSSDLCDGSDASGGGTATDTPWQMIPSGVRLTTSTNQVVIGANATNTLAKLEVNGNVYFSGNATASDITATGTASTTQLIVSRGATTTNLGILGLGGAGILKVNAGGGVGVATAGTDFQSPITATYPVQFSSNIVSLAFGTTTNNTWSGLNIFGMASTTAFSSLQGVFVGRTSTTTILGDGATSTIPNATSTNFAISRSFTLFGSTYTSNNAFCIALTGSSALCDGDDATGGGSGVQLPSFIVAASGGTHTTIQGALDACGASGGGNIVVTGESYSLGGTGLTFKGNNCHLMGRGLGTTTLNFTGATTYFKTNSAAAAYSNNSIDGFLILGDGNASSIAFDLSDMSHFELSHTQTDNVGTWMRFNDTQNVTFYDEIHNNQVTTLGVFGVNASSTNPVNKNTFRNNFFGCASSGCIAMQFNNANGNIITNNSIEPATLTGTVGIKLFDNKLAANNGVFNNTISDNYIEANGVGISIATTLNTTGGIKRNRIANNTVEANTLDFHFPSGASSTVIALQTWDNNYNSNFGIPLTSFQGPFGIGTSSQLENIAATPFSFFGVNASSAVATNQVVFSLDNRTDFVLNNSGNVGIGTSSPYAKLSVTGLTAVQNIHATSTTATSTFSGDVRALGRTLNSNGDLFSQDYTFIVSTTSATGQFVGGSGIQAALDALPSTGGTIFIRPGTYTCPVTGGVGANSVGWMIKTQNTRLIGEAIATTLQCDNFGSGGASTTIGMARPGLGNIVIKDLRISNSNANAQVQKTKTGVGLNASNTPLLYVDDVEFAYMATGTILNDSANQTFYNSLNNIRYTDVITCLEVGGVGNPVNDNWFSNIRCAPRADGGGYGVFIGGTSQANQFTNWNTEPQVGTTSTSSVGIRIGASVLGAQFENAYIEGNATGTEILSGAENIYFNGGEITANTKNVDIGANAKLITFQNIVLYAPGIPPATGADNIVDRSNAATFYNISRQAARSTFMMGTSTPANNDTVMYLNSNINGGTNPYNTQLMIVNASGFASDPMGLTIMDSVAGFDVHGNFQLVCTSGSGYANNKCVTWVANAAKIGKELFTYDGANQRLGVSTSTPLHTLDVKGRINGQPMMDCNIPVFASVNITTDRILTGSIGGVCGDRMHLDVNTSGGGVLAETDNSASGTPSLMRMSASISAPAANNLAAIKSFIVGGATSSMSRGIAAEQIVRFPQMGTASSGPNYSFGFSDVAAGSVTVNISYSNPTNGCLIQASTTPNFKLYCFKAGVPTVADTGIATSTAITSGVKFLLVLDGSGANVFVNGGEISRATIASANLPVMGLRYQAHVGINAVQSPIGVTIGQAVMDIGNIKVWAGDMP